jgi:hypothetical protein
MAFTTSSCWKARPLSAPTFHAAGDDQRSSKIFLKMATFLFTSESVNEGHPGASKACAHVILLPSLMVFWRREILILFEEKKELNWKKIEKGTGKILIGTLT